MLRVPAGGQAGIAPEGGAVAPACDRGLVWVRWSSRLANSGRKSLLAVGVSLRREARPMHYSLETTCPSAKWTNASPERLEYGIPDFYPCSIVSYDSTSVYGWEYRLRCEVSNSQFSSRKHTRDGACEQVIDLLRGLKCPGKLCAPPATQEG